MRGGDFWLNFICFLHIVFFTKILGKITRNYYLCALGPNKLTILEMKNTGYKFDSLVLNSSSMLPTASLEYTSMAFKKQKELAIVKKLFFLIVAVAAMLNLCSCGKEPIDKPNTGKAIVFNNIPTRGVVTSADELLGMGVFAQMNLGNIETREDGCDDYTLLLDNEYVSRTSSSAPWTYEHTRYWVADRVYHFFAVWPYSEDEDNKCVTNVSSVAGGDTYGYSVTFETPAAADQELLTAKTRVETKTGEEFPESVGLDFQHELTNVNLKVWSNGESENVQDEVKIKEITISNVTKGGTLNATVTGSSWDYSSDKMSFTTTYAEGLTVSQAQIINGELVPNGISANNPSNNSPAIPFGDNGLLLIPHTITESDPVVVTVVYDLKRPSDPDWEVKRLQVSLPEITWPAGKKLTYNLILSGDRNITEFEIIATVEDWIPHTEEIDFSQQVEVREYEKMRWTPGTYQSLNEERGEVVLYTDVTKVAICEFNIRAPIGATWTASLIPLTASAMDAFSIVEGSKYGNVGTDDMQQVKIKINNPDPISARNACLLRITVQTSDGRTIVVKDLMPEAAADNDIEEFTIIQNLING